MLDCTLIVTALECVLSSVACRLPLDGTLVLVRSFGRGDIHRAAYGLRVHSTGWRLHCSRCWEGGGFSDAGRCQIPVEGSALNARFAYEPFRTWRVISGAIYSRSRINNNSLCSKQTHRSARARTFFFVFASLPSGLLNQEIPTKHQLVDLAPSKRTPASRD